MSRYLIPQYNIPQLTKKINTIKNKGVNVTFNIEEPFNYKVDKLGDGRVIPCVWVEVSGKYIIDGWRFVATIQHASPENIIRVADVSMADHIPERYRYASQACEHCHIRRDRNDTYLVYNEDDLEWKQVGRTCLRSYTNGLDAETCALFADVMSELDKEESRLSRTDEDEFLDFDGKIKYEMDYARKKAYVYVEENGYESGVTPNKFFDAFLRNEIKNKATDSEIREVTDWLNSNTMSSDYIRNARAVWNKEIFEGRDSGLLTSIISVFLKAKQRMQAFNSRRQSNLNNSANQWAGEVGERISFELASSPVVLYTKTGGNPWHPMEYPVYKLIGTDGKIYIWACASQQTLETGNTITGTIKKLIERPDGEKQTEVTRCRVSGN